MESVTIKNTSELFQTLQKRNWDFLSNPVTLSQKRLYTYLKSYPEFIKYFKNVAKIEYHHLIIGANFTYGWMPTILVFKNNHSERIINKLNQLRNEKYTIVENDVQEIREFLNNSVSGTTKLIHFIQPNKYPILDRNIYDLLGNSSSPNAKNYIDFVGNCQKIIKEPSFRGIHKRISGLIHKHFKYDITTCRSLELLIFLGTNQYQTI